MRRPLLHEDRGCSPRIAAELRKELQARGIVVRRPSNAELAEEAPLAYKDVEKVVEVVHLAGIARKVARLGLSACSEADRFTPCSRGGDMPEKGDKEALEKAREDMAEGKAPTTAAGEFVREEIHHVREGKHGARSPKQAIAIGLSKARRAGVKLPPPAGGKVSAEVQRKAEQDIARGRKHRPPSGRRSRAIAGALRRESRGAASRQALSRQALTAAARRSASERSRAAKKASATKGPAQRRAAARKAARTREAHP